jgi:hypothetical protein
MQQRPPWKVGIRSAGQEIPCLLWNPKAHCRVHKSQLTIQNLCHMNSLLILTHRFFKMCFNIISVITPSFTVGRAKRKTCKGVAVFVHKNWRHEVLSHAQISEGIIALPLKIDRGDVTITDT